MTLIQLLEQARELAYREHNPLIWCDAVCYCGAGEHNQKVDEVFEELTHLLIEKHSDD